MSEELNCPCCGGELVMDEEGDAYHCCECFFACEPKYMPNLAAAMELAKTIVESENCKAEDEYKYQEFVEWARQYVLEVFK